MLLIHLLKNFQNVYNKKSSADSTDNTLYIVYISWYDVFEVFLGVNQLALWDSPSINQEEEELELWSKFPYVSCRVLKSPSALTSTDAGQSGTHIFFGETPYFFIDFLFS